MAEESTFLASQRYAVVTEANKGIELEICRILACKGINVVLTSKRGIKAVEKLKSSGVSAHVVFHPLDVTDPQASLPSQILSRLRLNILRKKIPDVKN